MKILLVHNKYQQKGGEDAVFQAEGELLEAHGHTVERLVFDNKEINSFVSKLLSGFRVIYNPASARVLARKIEAFAPNIVHIHNFFPIASPSIYYVAKRYHIPVIQTLHNYRLLCPSATLFHNNAVYEKSIHRVFPLDAVRKGVYRNSKIQTAALATMTAVHNLLGTWRNKVDRYIVLSNFAKKKFSDSALNLPQEKLVLKPNFAFDLGVGEAERDDTFVFISRLVEDKGTLTVLEAAQRYGFKLVIIGDGPLKATVEASAQANKNITYLGYQQKQALMYQIKKCRAVIVPSILYETFGMTILEAFSTGTPVITSRLGAMEELVDDGINGFHFEAGNALDLVAKIKQMQALSPEAYGALSKHARQRYVENFTPEKNYQQLHHIYEQAIKSQRQAVRKMMTDSVMTSF